MRAAWSLFLILAAAQAAHGAPPPAAAATKREALDPELLKLRDPFKRPKPPQVSLGEAISPLEQFPVSAFKMLGVVTGPDRVRAMLADSTGHTHFVAENMRIGTRRGRIVRITPERVVVRERIPNVLGVMEDIDTVLSLPGERKSGENPEENKK